jgi:transcriptional regulator with XRE-family HTH domain
MSSSSTNFGEKLRTLRKNLHKSQIEVVEEIERLFPDKIRISQTTLSALEQRASAPRQDVLEVLAQYYEVPITHFFESETERGEKVDRAKQYLETLKNRTTQRGDIRLHTTENSSGDKEVRDSLDNYRNNNLRHWQPEEDDDLS